MKPTSIVEREYNTQTVHQGYIEPFACTAQWMPGGAPDHLDKHSGHIRRAR